jgi:transcriptional regulator with XRE-family HTH domain
MLPAVPPPSPPGDGVWLCCAHLFHIARLTLIYHHGVPHPLNTSQPLGKLMSARHLRAMDVAHDVGVSERTLEHIRRGERTPSAAVAARLSNLFGVPIPVLFPEETYGRPHTRGLDTVASPDDPVIFRTPAAERDRARRAVRRAARAGSDARGLDV